MSLDVMLVVFQLVVLVFAFSVHGCVQAYTALRLGDTTAYMLGRVSLNPARQLDPWGSVLMPLLGLFFGGALIGWGKAVPLTLRNFRKIKRDDLIVTLSGPASNLLMALVALILLLAMKHMPGLGADAVVSAMAMAKRMPMDMSLLPKLFPVALLLYYCVVTNLLLFVFNFIPVPPLDGSRILRNYLPYETAKKFDQMGMIGSLVIFFVAGRIFLPIFYPPLLNAFDSLLLSL